MITRHGCNKSITQYSSLINRLKHLPLWVKQAIYTELRTDIKNVTDFSCLDDDNTRLIQLYRPQITTLGITATTKKNRYDTLSEVDLDHKSFLSSSKNKMCLLEIAHQNIWSFQRTCRILFEAIDNGYVEQINDYDILLSAMYLTGEIKAEEYLIRTNKISTKQLDRAMQLRRYSNKILVNQDVTDILANIGSVDANLLKHLTSLKDSSEEIVNVIDQVESQSEDIVYFQEEINKLISQKRALKERLEFYKVELQTYHDEILRLNNQLGKFAKGILGKVFLTITQ